MILPEQIMELNTIIDDWRLPDSLRVGQIHLRISNLQAALEFYRDHLGFHQSGTSLLSRERGSSHLVKLTEAPSAPSRRRGTPGLFHVAFRYPDRRALAHGLIRFLKNGYPVQGAADHRVSDALYLADPDGNGVELYCDRPRDSWPRQGAELAMATDPLDVEALLAEAAGSGVGDAGLPDIGHIHLQVSDLARSEKFYHDLLGLAVTQRSYPGALFMSAGGYHHHIAVNTWGTRGSSAAAPDTLGLVSYSLDLGNTVGYQALHSRIVSKLGSDAVRERGEGKTGFTVLDPDSISVEIVPT
jgi:catechol 2,3-dioxygenase